MDEQGSKRKARPDEGADHRGGKRSKRGTGGKWQTAYQKANASAARGGAKVEPGDVGIWATCVREKEGKANEELKLLFEEYAELMYGIQATAEDSDTVDADIDDIESSILKEVASMGKTKNQAALFTSVFIEVPCVLFFKIAGPVKPVEFVHKICHDAMHNGAKRKHRFLNRLTPVTLTGKATEKGLEEVGRTVLSEHFQLNSGEPMVQQKFEEANCSAYETFHALEMSCARILTSHKYAIRPTIRHHSTLTRDVVIKLVASLVGSQHKVDLTKPDKVILVEIYQTTCGMSVVGSDWESLKRFNLAEIYQPTLKPKPDGQGIVTQKAIPDVVTADEAPKAEQA